MTTGGASAGMRVGVTGASGFVGSTVVRMLAGHGHQVVAYSRSPDRPLEGAVEVRAFDGRGGKTDLSSLDALVHLAGEPVAWLWTRRKRGMIRSSRVVPTRGIADAMGACGTGIPRVWVCASATGYYGDRGDERLVESSAGGRGFLASVCREWEDAASGAAEVTRLVNLRLGVVLGRGGGALGPVSRIFRLGLGGRLGDGSQWMPWIHVLDVAGIVVSAIESADLRGPVNAVAPGLVRNVDFTRTLARVVRRPAWAPVPAFLLRALLRDQSEMVLASQRVVPDVLTAAGHAFRYPDLEGAMGEVFG